MKLLVASQLLLLCFSVVEGTCPTGWASNGMGKCYLMGARSGSWHQCMMFCDVAYFFSSMLCVENAAENAWLQNNLGGNTWTGLSSNGFSWFDAAYPPRWADRQKTCPSTYTNWIPGEPNNSGESALLKPSSSGKWDDAPYGDNFRCGCEIAEPADPILCPAGWRAGPGKCYAFPSALQSVTACTSTCNAMGGLMPCVQTIIQNAYLRYYGDIGAYLSYNDIATEGSFVWQAGCSSSYVNWYTGEPNAKKNEDCTLLDPVRLGYWLDIPCNENWRCVCETGRLTRAPTALPTVLPTAKPSVAPTAVPSAAPSFAPTKVPTASPSRVPTAKPTIVPTAVPTAKPSTKPTFTPSAVPSNNPTAAPSKNPTAGPSAAPTETPTAAPSFVPTAEPSVGPSADPTEAPTHSPTVAPSFTPTVEPSPLPTIPGPSPSPTAAPTAYYVCPNYGSSLKVGNKCYDFQGGVTTYDACLDVCALFQASYRYRTTMVCLESVAELSALNYRLRVMGSMYPYNVYPGGRSWVAAKQGSWDANCPSTYQPPLHSNDPGQCWYIVPGYVNDVYSTTNCPSEKYRCICETRTDVPRLAGWG